MKVLNKRNNSLYGSKCSGKQCFIGPYLYAIFFMLFLFIKSLFFLLLMVQEGDGASSVLTAIQGEKPEKLRGEDDDLTSLTWLQDKNLLKGDAFPG